MSRACVIELAARHRIDADELLESWAERAAIREYLAGFSRRAAELWAIGDVERMYQFGLHDPETLRRMAAGGNRMRCGYSAATTAEPEDRNAR